MKAGLGCTSIHQMSVMTDTATGIWSDIVDRLDAVAQACSNGHLPQDTVECNLLVEPFADSTSC